MKRSRLSGAALAVAALGAALVATAAYGMVKAGVTGQLDYQSCISGSTADTCSGVAGMAAPTGIGLTDDESRMFAASPSSNGVSVFNRDRTTGRLQQLDLSKGGCTNESGSGGCLDGHGLSGANDVVSVANNAYVAATGSNGVAWITRDNDTGKWTQVTNNVGCLSEPAADGCGAARALAGATSVEGTGGYVYVGGPGSIAVFKRGDKGVLKQLADEAGCINDAGSNGCTNGSISGTVTDLMIARSGNTLYAVDGNAVLVFARSRTTGELTQLASPTLTNLSGPNGVGIDQTGNPMSVYITGTGNTVGVFKRDKKTGLLTQLPAPDGCVSQTGTGGQCTAAPALGNIGNLVKAIVYKTNRFVYVAGDSGVGVFSRNKGTGALAQLSGAPGVGCMTETGSGGQCLTGKGLGGLTDILSTGGGKHVYVSGTDFDSVVTAHQGG